MYNSFILLKKNLYTTSFKYIRSVNYVSYDIFITYKLWYKCIIENDKEIRFYDELLLNIHLIQGIYEIHNILYSKRCKETIHLYSQYYLIVDRYS